MSSIELPYHLASFLVGGSVVFFASAYLLLRRVVRLIGGSSNELMNTEVVLIPNERTNGIHELRDANEMVRCFTDGRLLVSTRMTR